MKIKHWLTALCALTMALLLAVPAAAEDDTGVSGTTATSEALDNIDLGSTGSIQLLFAKLQLAQAQLCKSSAESYLQGTSSAVNDASNTLAALSASKSGSLLSTDGAAIVSGQYALAAFAALVGGAGGTALMWAIISRKQAKKEAAA